MYSMSKSKTNWGNKTFFAVSKKIMRIGNLDFWIRIEIGDKQSLNRIINLSRYENLTYWLEKGP